MDLLVLGRNFKQFVIPVSPPPPPTAATTCSCSFYKPLGSAVKFSSPFWTYPLARNPNKLMSPISTHARKKNSKSEPLLKPSIVEEVSMVEDDEEEEQLLLDEFEDDESMIADGDDYFEEQYVENETELCVGDGAGGGGILFAGTWWDKEALALAEDVCLSFGGDLGIYAFKTLSNSSIQVRIERLTNKSGSPTMEDIEAFSVSYRARLDEAELARSVAENITLEAFSLGLSTLDVRLRQAPCFFRSSVDLPQALAMLLGLGCDVSDTGMCLTRVSSPGVERVVRIPQDLERFKDRSMYVKYVTEVGKSGSVSEADGVLRLVSFDMEAKSCIWGLADVRINREKAGKGRPLSKKQKEWRLETTFDSLRLVRLYSEV